MRMRKNSTIWDLFSMTTEFKIGDIVVDKTDTDRFWQVYAIDMNVLFLESKNIQKMEMDYMTRHMREVWKMSSKDRDKLADGTVVWFKGDLWRIVKKYYYDGGFFYKLNDYHSNSDARIRYADWIEVYPISNLEEYKYEIPQNELTYIAVMYDEDYSYDGCVMSVSYFDDFETVKEEIESYGFELVPVMDEWNIHDKRSSEFKIVGRVYAPVERNKFNVP